MPFAVSVFGRRQLVKRKNKHIKIQLTGNKRLFRSGLIIHRQCAPSHKVWAVSISALLMRFNTTKGSEGSSRTGKFRYTILLRFRWTLIQYVSLKDNSRSIQKYVLRIFMFAGAIILPRVCIQTGSSSLLSPKLPICMHDSRRISHLKGLKMQWNVPLN